MTDNATASKQSYGRLLLSMVAGLSLAVAAGLVSIRSMMPTVAHAADIKSEPKGTPVEVAVKVIALPSDGFFDGKALEKDGFGYKQTDEVIHFRLADNATVAMGQRSDIRVGAILSVNAMTASPDQDELEAERVVILTGYVSVN